MSVQQLLQPSAQYEPWAHLYVNGLDAGTFSTSSSVLSVADQKLGFFNGTAHTQGVGGAQATVSAAGATAANTETTYTGGVGSSAYSVGQLVLILKNFGLIAQ